MAKYVKFCYWLTHREFRKAREILETDGFTVNDETRIPCRVLRSSLGNSYIDPKAWKGFCQRRTSWYWKSEKVGKFLLVSNKACEFLDSGEVIHITESKIRPERFPTLEEMIQLVKSRRYRKGKPRVWEKVGSFEKEAYRRWFEARNSEEPFRFDELFLHHSANHANFMDPKFFILTDGVKAPYSISDSIHTCSSCLEFFNILGSQCTLKYVVPCSGAVQFAHLPVDRYLQVKCTPKKTN
jgi:hypothetical protein